MTLFESVTLSVELREVRVTQKFELSGFFQFWVNGLAVLHQTEFFHCQYWKSIFLGILYFFRLKIEVKRQPLPCKYSEKSATLRRCCARTACQAARFSVERLDKDSNNRNPSAPYDLSANCGDIAARTCAFLQWTPSLGGTFRYSHWKISVGVRTKIQCHGWKKKEG